MFALNVVFIITFHSLLVGDVIRLENETSLRKNLHQIRDIASTCKVLLLIICSLPFRILRNNAFFRGSCLSFPAIMLNLYYVAFSF